MTKSISQKIFRNTVFNITGSFWSVLVMALLTPYIIKQISLERYGIWVLMGVVSGYYGLFDFGVGTSFVRYISDFYARKDYRKINQLVNTGFVFYLFVGALIIILNSFFIRPLLTFLRTPVYLYQEALFVFIAGVSLFCLSCLTSPFRAIEGGLQRMDITNKIAVSVSALNIFGTIYFLKNGYGLTGLALNYIIITAITCIAHIVVAFRILPELEFNPFMFTREIFRKMFNFGYKMQVAVISTMISMHFNKLLISRFLFVSLVTFYQLGSFIVEQAVSVVSLLLSALVPAFSELHAAGNRDRLVEGYTKGTKFLAFIAIPLFTFIFICADRIMGVWMGQGYGESAKIIRVLGVGWLFAVLSGMRSVVVQATAKTEIEMHAGLVAAVFNIPLSIILIKRVGFLGVAIGTSVALFASAAYALVRLHRELDIPVVDFIKETLLKIAFVSVITGLLTWGVSRALSQFFPEPNRGISLIFLFTQGFLFLGMYILSLRYIKPFERVDIVSFKEKVPVVWHLLKAFSR